MSDFRLEYLQYENEKKLHALKEKKIMELLVRETIHAPDYTEDGLITITWAEEDE